MSTAITLPDHLMKRLQNRAAQLGLSVDEFATRLIEDALAQDRLLDSRADAEHDPFPSLEDVITAIKNAPKEPGCFHPPTKSIDELLAELEANPSPEPQVTPEEWDRLWAEFERELKEIDRADDLAEGRS